jgi:hypothetical protein
MINPQTETSARQTLVELLKRERPDRRAIAAYLDSLSHAERMAEITQLSGPRLQRRLWEAVADAPLVTLADMVPADAAPLREVIFHGKNSLPAFTLFQKRFCRSPRGRDELWGYNHQTLAWLTGPGYFVVHDDRTRGAAIDYREVPPERPASWPEIQPNDRGFSRFVYKGMIDYMRRVSQHVFIGAATRNGKELGNYFILCRES